MTIATSEKLKIDYLTLGFMVAIHIGAVFAFLAGVQLD